MSSSELRLFLETHVAGIKPLSRAVNLAYWNASISGKKSDFVRSATLQVQLQRHYSSTEDFERIRAWRETHIDDPVCHRQLDLLHNSYLRNQIDPGLNERITILASEIENQFNVHRAKINGRAVTSNEILRILKESTDSELRKRAWEAGKKVGEVVKDDLLTLVKLRNEAAQSLGYRNYYSMAMELSEQNEDEIVTLFDELEQLSREPFVDLKKETDEQLAMRHGIEPSDIRPWHYEDPFFQEAPQVYDVDLDKYYADQNILELVSKFYSGIGLDANDIIERSDLHEKPGKDQHAYCTDIDRNGDIRILANIKQDENWVGTMLHELGHAVHDKYIDPQLPFLLRQEAHIFTTEAIAMLFGRLSKDADWIQRVTGMSDSEKENIAGDLLRRLRLHQLIFARWSQVMMHFERQLYLDPDQDLNSLWWELAGKYQMLTPPDKGDYPHWASKTHIVSVPVYYHNYLLGEILASQLSHHIRTHVLPPGETNGCLNGHPAVGAYLKEKVFHPGARFRWNEMIERATGEPLTPEYFVEQFVH
jgi:peptidyl-dipeptidase A